MRMEKFNILYDHYKDTYAIIAQNINFRNRFFILTFIIMILQFLFAVNQQSIATLIISLVYNTYEIDVSGQISIIQCLLWIILLYITMRYYQTNVYIERMYLYIHVLENQIENNLKFNFNRESKNYLKNYPKMNDMIDFLYKWFFPVLYCTVIIIKITTEFKQIENMILFIIDLVVFSVCFELTLLYLLFLHNKNPINE